MKTGLILKPYKGVSFIKCLASVMGTHQVVPDTITDECVPILTSKPESRLSYKVDGLNCVASYGAARVVMKHPCMEIKPSDVIRDDDRPRIERIPHKKLSKFRKYLMDNKSRRLVIYGGRDANIYALSETIFGLDLLESSLQHHTVLGEEFTFVLVRAGTKADNPAGDLHDLIAQDVKSKLRKFVTGDNHDGFAKSVRRMVEHVHNFEYTAGKHTFYVNTIDSFKSVPTLKKLSRLNSDDLPSTYHFCDAVRAMLSSHHIELEDLRYEVGSFSETKDWPDVLKYTMKLYRKLTDEDIINPVHLANYKRLLADAEGR